MNKKQWMPLLAAGFAYGAQAAEADDLAVIRAQIAEMKQVYEGRIAALEQKLARAEAERPAAREVVKVNAPPDVPAAYSASATLSPPVASGFNPDLSLILQGQYKNQKSIVERGITGFWPAAGHNHTGVAESDKRGFSLDHTEVVLAANVDPFWRGQAILAVQDGQTEVEEAWFQRLGMGNGLGLKAGRLRSGIGYLNEQHPHQWDFADAPLMYQALFGTHGSYAQDGVQVKWLAPTPVFLEFGAEFGRGASFPGTDRNKNGSGAGALFAHAGGDVGFNHAWRAGLSYLRTSARGREGHLEDIAGDEVLGQFSGKSETVIADMVWKWQPTGSASRQALTLQTEYFNRRELGSLRCDDAIAGTATACNGGVALGDYRSRQSGWYAQGVWQFSPEWRAGLRHDRLSSGQTRIDPAALATVNAASASLTRYQPVRDSVMVDYSWSEFSRLRLQWARDRSMQGVTDNQLTLQYIMSLGAHGAHKF